MRTSTADQQNRMLEFHKGELLKILQRWNAQFPSQQRLLQSELRALVARASFRTYHPGALIIKRGTTRLTRNIRGTGPNEALRLDVPLGPVIVKTVIGHETGQKEVHPGTVMGVRAGRIPEFVFNAGWDSKEDLVDLVRIANVLAKGRTTVAHLDFRDFGRSLRAKIRPLCEEGARSHRQEAARTREDEAPTEAIMAIQAEGSRIETVDEEEEPTVDTTPVKQSFFTRAWEAVTGPLRRK